MYYHMKSWLKCATSATLIQQGSACGFVLTKSALLICLGALVMHIDPNMLLATEQALLPHACLPQTSILV